MIYIGIDISKYKHDCFICKDTGEVIVENLSFDNNKKGFQQFLNLLKPYDNSNVHIGLEATGHYGLNLKLFLEKNNYSFMEFNPLLVKEFYKSLSLRKTKTDKVDATVIAQKLMSVPYKPNSCLFYHKYSSKSLSRLRETLVKQRSKYINILGGNENGEYAGCKTWYCGGEQGLLSGESFCKQEESPG